MPTYPIHRYVRECAYVRTCVCSTCLHASGNGRGQTDIVMCRPPAERKDEGPAVRRLREGRTNARGSGIPFRSASHEPLVGAAAGECRVLSQRGPRTSFRPAAAATMPGTGPSRPPAMTHHTTVRPPTCAPSRHRVTAARRPGGLASSAGELARLGSARLSSAQLEREERGREKIAQAQSLLCTYDAGPAGPSRAENTRRRRVPRSRSALVHVPPFR